MLALPPKHIVSLVLARRGHARGSYGEADARLRRALADAEAARPPDPLALAAALNALGLLRKDLARYQEACGYYRRALGLLEGNHELHAEQIATLYHNLGGVEHARAEYAAGEAFARRGLAIRAAIPGSDPCALAADQAALAAILDGQEQWDEAERLYLDAIATLEHARGDYPHDLAVALAGLGAQYLRRERPEAALPLLSRAAVLKTRALGASHPHTAVTLNNLAMAYRRTGDPTRAAALYAQALEILERSLGPDHPNVVTCRRNLSQLHPERSEGPTPPASSSGRAGPSLRSG